MAYRKLVREDLEIRLFPYSVPLEEHVDDIATVLDLEVAEFSGRIVLVTVPSISQKSPSSKGLPSIGAVAATRTTAKTSHAPLLQRSNSGKSQETPWDEPARVLPPSSQSNNSTTTADYSSNKTATKMKGNSYYMGVPTISEEDEDEAPENVPLLTSAATSSNESSNDPPGHKRDTKKSKTSKMQQIEADLHTKSDDQTVKTGQKQRQQPPILIALSEQLHQEQQKQLLKKSSMQGPTLPSSSEEASQSSASYSFSNLLMEGERMSNNTTSSSSTGTSLGMEDPSSKTSSSSSTSFANCNITKKTSSSSSRKALKQQGTTRSRSSSKNNNSSSSKKKKIEVSKKSKKKESHKRILRPSFKDLDETARKGESRTRKNVSDANWQRMSFRKNLDFSGETNAGSLLLEGIHSSANHNDDSVLLFGVDGVSPNKPIYPKQPELPRLSNTDKNMVSSALEEVPEEQFEDEFEAQLNDDEEMNASSGRKASQAHAREELKAYMDETIVGNTVASTRETMKRVLTRHRSNESITTDMDPVGAFLHQRCKEGYDKMFTPDGLTELLQEYPHAAKCLDTYGRLPLHVLSSNTQLLKDAPGRLRATELVRILIQAYPASVIIMDNSSRMPFVSLLRRWTDLCYKDRSLLRDRPTGNKQIGMNVVSKIKGTAKSVLNRAKGVGSQSSMNNTSRRINRSLREDMNNTSSQINMSLHDDMDCISSHKGERTGEAGVNPMVLRGAQLYDKIIPPEIPLWPYVEWCFYMLSMVMDELGAVSFAQLQKRKNKSDELLVENSSEMFEFTDHQELLVSNVVQKVPQIIKTLFLLNNGSGPLRAKILRLPIVRRIILHHESVGQWLTAMLRKKGLASKLAIDYLEDLSQTTVEDYVGGSRTPLPDDEQAFYIAKEKVFVAIEGLGQMVPSLIVLNEKDTERAAATKVLWFIMDRSLARPFVVGLVLIDFMLHVTLMLSFRSDINITYEGEAFLANVPSWMILTICAHYLIRKGTEALSFLIMSKKAFKGYFLEFWNILDILSVCLTLAASAWNQENPGQYRPSLNAFILGLLWIKVLGYLKIINKQMATFILALFQIVKDIRYFLLVLLVFNFLFADMIHVILTTEEQDFCSAEELAPSEEDFCSEWSFNFYLRMFGILLGDFAVEEYKQTTSIAVIFVLFIMFGVIILLNVLIALISDSYIHAKTSSVLLFGRARVAVIAELNALESFLRPGYNPFQNLEKVTSALQLTGYCTRYVVVVCSYLGRLVVLLTLLGSAGIADYYLFERGYEIITDSDEHFREYWWLALVYVFFFWLLFCGIWVIVSYLLTELFKEMVPDNNKLQPVFVSANYCTRVFTNFITTRIFGLQQQQTINDFIALFERDDFDQKERTMEQWGERLAMLEESLKQSVRDTEQILMEQIVSSENRVDAVERNIRQEMRYQLTPLLKVNRRRGKSAGLSTSGTNSLTSAEGDGDGIPSMRRNGRVDVDPKSA